MRIIYTAEWLMMESISWLCTRQMGCAVLYKLVGDAQGTSHNYKVIVYNEWTTWFETYLMVEKGPTECDT